MKHYLRLLTGLLGLAALCLTQLGAVAHAGFSGATFRVDLTVTTAAPAPQGSVSGAFTYGITCTAPNGPVLTFAPPAMTTSVNAAVTPFTGVAFVTTGNNASIIAPNVCTVAQLSRPAPPSGYVWNSSPPNVVLSNVLLNDPPETYPAAFANVLSLPTVTGVANPTQGGSVTCTQTTILGGTSSCTATPNSGYSFTGFTTSSCGSASTANPFITSALTGDCTVTGLFTLTPVTVTGLANPLAGGAVNCVAQISNGKMVNLVPGQQSTCTAIANSGYTFAGFTTSGCGPASTNNPYTTNPVTSNCTVTAAFTLNTFPITTTVNLPAGGSVNCLPSPVAVGSTATCTVITNGGYVLTGISGCGGTTTAPGTFVTAPMTAACLVAATFAPFAVTPSVPVPTLGTWMLILLGLLTVGIASAFSARRSR